jgi:hypothetical protein
LGRIIGSLLAAACVAASMLFLPACGRQIPPLAGGAPSAVVLARAVAAALERADLPALRALSLNEQEFRDHVWPDLPASRPERNLPFSYVWGDLRQKSEASLSQTLLATSGRHLEVLAVKQLRPATQYRSYVVHRQTQLTVKNNAGHVQDVRLFGSILEKDGQFKVFSYVTD